MKDWFTTEAIDENTYVISEYEHYEETHCYLLCGTKSALLIDTGLGVADIAPAVARLTDLPVLVALTHAHWDHIGGLHSFLHTAVHEAERDWLTGRFPLPLSAVKKALTAEPCAFPKDFCVEDYTLFHGEPERILHDGDSIDLGGRVIHVMHTPGHSPGHCCFYEPARRALYTGDLIYLGCLFAFYPTTDPVQYLDSVRRISALQVDRVLPGHHALCVPADLLGRVEAGFTQLEQSDRLKQGMGTFDFGDFQIRI